MTAQQLGELESMLEGDRSTPTVPEPLGAPPAVLTGVLLALVLVVVGGVGIHDALVAAGWVGGPAWLDPVLTALDHGVGRSVPTLLVGIVLALLGLWLLRRAVGRRQHRELSLGEHTHAWTTPGDAARIAALVASDVEGVLTVRPRVSRRTVTVRVGALEGAEVAEPVRAAVAAALDGLQPGPRVRVRVTRVGGAR